MCSVGSEFNPDRFMKYDTVKLRKDLVLIVNFLPKF